MKGSKNMRVRICILFIFAFWVTSANSVKAQGSDATVKKPNTETKKATTSKPQNNASSKTNTAKQTPKSSSSSRRKSVAGTSSRRKSAARDDSTNDTTGEFVERIDTTENNVAFRPIYSSSGRWTGDWDNSRGGTGTSTINIVEDTNGIITGDEDGWTIENGRRSGNILTWEYRNQNTGCRDYTVRLELSADGSLINGTYRVADRCENLVYTGNYINYRK